MSLRSRALPWVGRLSATFLILAGLLLWEAYKAVKGQLGPVSHARVFLFVFGALASFGLSVVGVRQRHRAIYDDPSPGESPPTPDDKLPPS